jgi:prepilin-type N-terminal cleavage/methylation domain-containing protein
MTLDKLKCRKGFTLVEILVVLAISGIIVTTAYTFLLSNQSAYFSVMSKIDAQKDARYAMDNVIENIRRSDQKQLQTIENGNNLSLEIPDHTNTISDFKYTVEKNEDTGCYELILTKGTTRYVVATNLDGENGFSVTITSDHVIAIKIKTQVKRFNQVSNIEVENYHKIRVDL